MLDVVKKFFLEINCYFFNFLRTSFQENVKSLLRRTFVDEKI